MSRISLYIYDDDDGDGGGSGIEKQIVLNEHHVPWVTLALRFACISEKLKYICRLIGASNLHQILIHSFLIFCLQFSATRYI